MPILISVHAATEGKDWQGKRHIPHGMPVRCLRCTLAALDRSLAACAALQCSMQMAVAYMSVAFVMQESALLTFPVGQDGVTDLAWSPVNGTVFAATTTGGCTEIWDMAASMVQPTCRLAEAGQGDRMLCLAFSKVCIKYQHLPLPPPSPMHPCTRTCTSRCTWRLGALYQLASGAAGRTDVVFHFSAFSEAYSKWHCSTKNSRPYHQESQLGCQMY